MGKWGRIQNEGGAKVQSRVRRGRGHFLYFLPLPNSISINGPYPPILPSPLQPSRYFSGSAWAQRTIGKEERGPRRPRLKIPGRNSHRKAELLVDWARHTSFPTRSGVCEVQETNRRAEPEQEMQRKLGDWGN